MKISTKQITITAVLLAVSIASQFFKGASVYLTGPVINASLMIAALTAGVGCGIILSVITPVTAFFISGSPVMAAGSILKALFMGIVIALFLIPSLLPAAMEGNMEVFQVTFSITQLITVLIGSVYAFLIWLPLKKIDKYDTV